MIFLYDLNISTLFKKKNNSFFEGAGITSCKALKHQRPGLGNGGYNIGLFQVKNLI